MKQLRLIKFNNYKLGGNIMENNTVTLVKNIDDEIIINLYYEINS